jgi:hypothetical protein
MVNNVCVGWLMTTLQLCLGVATSTVVFFPLWGVLWALRRKKGLQVWTNALNFLKLNLLLNLDFGS